MKDWVTMRREHLEEMIPILDRNLKKYQEIDTSQLDELNKESVERAIRDTKNLINEYREQLEIIYTATKGK